MNFAQRERAVDELMAVCTATRADHDAATVRRALRIIVESDDGTRTVVDMKAIEHDRELYRCLSLAAAEVQNHINTLTNRDRPLWMVGGKLRDPEPIYISKDRPN